MITVLSFFPVLSLIDSVTALITPRLLTIVVSVNTVTINVVHFMGITNFL
ncbi:hypothetical protein AAKU64_003799 [Undibacterium sp. GrIS 1.8]